MLTNTEMDTGANFALLLIGQPTLRRKLKLAVLAALDQRVSTRYAITGMNLPDTASYIRHHLTLAGRSDPLFSDDAVAAIHQASRGYPRAVNNLAISSLIATFATLVALPSVVVLARLFRSQLYGVTTFDPVTLTGAVLLTAIMVALAAALPACRATSIDPMQSLRAE